MMLSKSMLSMAMVFTCFAVGQDFLAAQAVPYPGRAAVAASYFNHPDYSGPNADVAKFFIFDNFSASSKDCILETSVSSGVIGLVDQRTEPPLKSGWTTGFDRILFVDRDKSDSALPDAFIIVGWNNTSKSNQVVRIVVAANGIVTQVPVSSVSAVGPIWVRAGIVGGKLYLFDLEIHAVRRMLDSNNDQVFDQLEAGFSVAVPFEDDPNDPSNQDATDLNPFLGFGSVGAESPGEEVLLNHLHFADTRAAVIMANGQGGWDLVRLGSLSEAQAIPTTLHVYGYLSSGQDRVWVAGVPGKSFEIYRKDPAGDVKISKTWTLPTSTSAVIDLTTPLMANWEIRAIAQNLPLRRWRTVSGSVGPALFQPSKQTIKELSSFKLQVGQFAPNHELYCTLNGAEIVFPSKIESTSQLAVTIPDFGLTGATPPLNKLKYLRLRVRDRSTLQPIGNHSIKLWISHN
ncbi:MAG: hypothetical protein V3W41_06980 [Planctomycetota bacterium]